MVHSPYNAPPLNKVTRRSQAFQIIIGQLLVTLLAAILLLPAGMEHALSGLIGGIIATLANAVFAMAIFVHYQADAPGKLIGRFYSAELLKLLLIGFLFAATFFLIKPLSVGALFGIFFLVQMTPIAIAHFFRH